MSRYPISFKTEVSEQAVKAGIVTTAIKYGLHRSTINNWHNKYRKSGVNGFIITRNDTQEVKLDNETLSKIHDFKKANPKATLNNIKEKFKLDCHISLINRKLNNFKSEKYESPSHNSLILKLNKIKSKFYNSIYQLSLYTSDGKIVSVGFTRGYSSLNICYFIRYTFDKIIRKCKKVYYKEVRKYLHCIQSKDFDRIVSHSLNISLKFSKLNKRNKNPVFISESTDDIDFLIQDTYVKILNSCNIFDYKFFTGIFNLDKLSCPVDYVNSPEPVLDSENKIFLQRSLEAILESGDSEFNLFEYDSALFEYKKVYELLKVSDLYDNLLIIDVLFSKAIRQ